MKPLTPHACRECLTDKPHECELHYWRCLDCDLLIAGSKRYILRAVDAHGQTGCRAVGVRVPC